MFLIWCFIIWFFTCLFFWSHLLIINGAAIPSCTRKINVLRSCKVSLLTITPEKIPVEDFIFNTLVNYCCLINCTENWLQFRLKNNDFGYILRTAVFQNNSKGLLLIATNKCHTRHCWVCWTKYIHEKENTRNAKERKFLKERNVVGCFNIYIVVLEFMSKLVARSKIKRFLLEYFSFAMSGWYD